MATGPKRNLLRNVYRRTILEKRSRQNSVVSSIFLTYISGIYTPSIRRGEEGDSGPWGKLQNTRIRNCWFVGILVKTSILARFISSELNNWSLLCCGVLRWKVVVSLHATSMDKENPKSVTRWWEVMQLRPRGWRPTQLLQKIPLLSRIQTLNTFVLISNPCS